MTRTARAARTVPPLVILLLCACGSLPRAGDPRPPSGPVTERPASLAQRMESAIAAELLSQARTLLQLEGNMPLAKLGMLFERLTRDVNLELVSPATRRQWQLLGHIVAAEKARRNETSFTARLERLTSLQPDLALLERQILAELDRIDRLIAAEPPATDAGHSGNTALEKSVPENSVGGRQAYMDKVSDALLQGQFRWHDSLTEYGESDLSINGVENDGATFKYNTIDRELVINLADVSRLPYFELPGLSAYYGFPGIHTLYAAASGAPVQPFLDLPGYSLGWALHITGHLAGRDEENATGLRRFVRLRISLALADLKLNAGEWDQEEALSFLSANRSYRKERLAASIAEIAASPGHYLAAFTGFQRFGELIDMCLAKADCNPTALHQQIVSLGPVTFEMLAAEL